MDNQVVSAGLTPVVHKIRAVVNRAVALAPGSVSPFHPCGY